MNPVVKLILFQLVVFVIYIGYIWIKYGVQDAISDSWYALKKHASLFTIFLWTIALPICIIGGITENEWYFGAGAFLCFTGVAADFKKGGIEEGVHVVGAAGAIILALFGLVTRGIWFPGAVVISFATVISLTRIPNKTWWVEIVAFIAIEAGMIHEVNKFSL